MTATMPSQLSTRDRAVLKAVAAGRCAVSGSAGTSLFIDGMYYSDQFAGSRLAEAGLITAPGSVRRTAQLTPSGRALLETF